MTVVICTNEHDLVWVFDDRTADKWLSKTTTPVGEYWAIAAAFAGDPLEMVYLQETESNKILLADPKWMGILGYMAVEINTPQTAILSQYPEFVSPRGSLMKLVASDLIRESNLPGFDCRLFFTSACTKYGLDPCQVLTAIRYGKEIDDDSSNYVEALAELESIFQRITDIHEFCLGIKIPEVKTEPDLPTLTTDDFLDLDEVFA
jgi:hypothetical protein